MTRPALVQWKDEDDVGGVPVGPMWLDGELAPQWVSKPEAMQVAETNGARFEEV